MFIKSDKQDLDLKISKLLNKISKEVIHSRYPSLKISDQSKNILKSLPGSIFSEYTFYGDFKKDNSSNVYSWFFSSYPDFFIGTLSLNNKEIFKDSGNDDIEIVKNLKNHINEIQKTLTKKEKFSLMQSLVKIAETKNDSDLNKIDELIYLLSQQIIKQ